MYVDFSEMQEDILSVISEINLRWTVVLIQNNHSEFVENVMKSVKCFLLT